MERSCAISRELCHSKGGRAVTQTPRRVTAALKQSKVRQVVAYARLAWAGRLGSNAARITQRKSPPRPQRRRPRRDGLAGIHVIHIQIGLGRRRSLMSVVRKGPRVLLPCDTRLHLAPRPMSPRLPSSRARRPAPDPASSQDHSQASHGSRRRPRHRYSSMRHGFQRRRPVPVVLNTFKKLVIRLTRPPSSSRTARRTPSSPRSRRPHRPAPQKTRSSHP